MGNAIVAYRYAKSLMDLAKEQKLVDEVNHDMVFFKQVGLENKELLSVLASPIVRHDKKLEILKKIFKERINPVTFSIFNVLSTKNRESLIFSIADEFSKLYDDLNGVQKVKVVSSTTLTDAQRAEFSKVVADATGKKVILDEKVDESLIGGYVLRVGDKQIDTSVKKKLSELKVQLLKN